ncbi:uncharacterized protein LOC101849373 isoform X2 [Aplysia californica]|uniref:Uncharacterized protein LOC101849373 isoform X2 n=1 Tax=Aplysia californica TaxID=6500 RepID=A0ABM1VSV7_APLCA|nr:uncharacterized protein LOC101849373 isoform X3 [Aplysia californica]XP_035825499.1 uncharacterized protein LOC101849373 isoform X2 [Aplysia californica]
MVWVELPADLEFECEVVGVACILDCSLRFAGTALYRHGFSSPGPLADAEDNLKESPSAGAEDGPDNQKDTKTDHRQEDPSAGVEDDLGNDAKDTTAGPSTGGPLCWSGG